VTTTTPKTGFTQTPRTLTVGTTARNYLLVVPGDYDNCKKYPLVMALHGDGDTGANFHAWMAFEKASTNNAILVYPDGANRTWNLTSEPSANGDIQFLLAVISDVSKSFTLDATKTYVTGFSSGAFMSNAFACHEPNVVRAIASNSGGAPFDQAQTWPGTGFAKCKEEAPVATLHVHGASDTTVETSSGRFAAQYWASVNGCGTAMSTVAGNASCKTYAGCPTGKAVEYCEVAGMAHTEWDQTPAVAWAFFIAQN
jgi:polyhydroxybutyrate depolymerase